MAHECGGRGARPHLESVKGILMREDPALAT